MSKSKLKLRDIDKDKMKSLLRYGDLGRIATRVPFSYQYVTMVVRGEKDNDQIWMAVAEYLDDIPELKLRRRTIEAIRKRED